MNAALLVGLGGALGAVARYGTGVLFSRAGITGFPWATMAVNVAGSLAMGVLIGWLAHATPSNQMDLQRFVAVGVLGGFTTFSAFSLDAVTLLERGQVGPAFAYMAGSVLVSLIALFIGLWAMRLAFA